MDNEVEIVVKARDDTRSGFESARRGVSRLKDRLDGFGGSLGSVGKSMMSSIAQGIMQTAGQVQDTLSSVFKGGLQGALSSGPIGLIILGAIGAVLVAIAAPLAALIAGAFALAFGAAFVGIGAMILLQNEKVMEKVGKQWEGIKETLTRAFQPLLPVITFLMDTLGKLAKEFEPVIKAASEMAAGPLKGFIKDLAAAFLELKPAIKPLMEAFTSIISAIGPMLKDVFGSISDSLIELADAVVENKDIIAAMFTAMLYVIPRVIDVIRVLTNWFGEMVRFVAREVVPRTISAVNTVKSTWNTVVTAVSGVVSKVKSFLSGLISFFTGLPGRISSAARSMFDAIPRAAQAAIDWAKRIISNITGFVNNIANNIRNSISGALSNLPGFAHGGIIGAAGGGPRSGMTLVGEQGPEIVRLPFGSQVKTAGATRAALGANSGDQPVTVNIYVQGSIRSDRDLIQLVRDEFMNGGFRGVVTSS